MKKSKKNYLKTISQIESVRKKNNTNWMDILRIAFENNPQKLPENFEVITHFGNFPAKKRNP
jgi:hypothetical protein